MQTSLCSFFFDNYFYTEARVFFAVKQVYFLIDSLTITRIPLIKGFRYLELSPYTILGHNMVQVGYMYTPYSRIFDLYEVRQSELYTFGGNRKCRERRNSQPRLKLLTDLPSSKRGNFEFTAIALVDGCSLLGNCASRA